MNIKKFKNLGTLLALVAPTATTINIKTTKAATVSVAAPLAAAELFGTDKHDNTKSLLLLF